MALRVIFMGTPDFALPALGALLKSRHQLIAVYTQPPRPAGRGMEVKKSPVHQWAERHGIAVYWPENFKNPDQVNCFQNLKADVAVVAAYGLLLPEAVLGAPRLGCINIHASLLPRWRGAAPIQYAILKADRETGVSIMQMEKGLDTGPVLARKGFHLAKNETAGTLHGKLAKLGGEMIVPVLDGLEKGTLKPVPQEDAKATTAPKIRKTEGMVDWRQPATEIERKIRAFNPSPGAFFSLRRVRIRALESRIETGKGQPGEVLDENLLIATGDQAVRILKLQKEGGKAMAAAEFLRGFAIPKGAKLDLP